jgi:hypothetical protein
MRFLDEIRQPHVYDSHWQSEAACTVDAANELIGNTVAGPPTEKLTEDEKRLIANYCGQCAVRSDCLAEALLVHEKNGIRGGLAERQRKKLQKDYDKVHFIDDKRWEAELQKAETVRTLYFTDPVEEVEEVEDAIVRPRDIDEIGPGGRRRYRMAKDVNRLIFELLSSQEGAIYVHEREGSIFEELSDELLLTPARIRRALQELAGQGRIEKIMQNGSKIGGLKLVS